jgi:hypothetical protein
MLLKHVYLYLNLDEYPDSLATAFGFRTRYVCNFLERRLRPLKFDAKGFSKICVQGRRKPLNDCPIVPENALLPTVLFEQEKYASLSPGEEHEFFIAMLDEGFDRAAPQHLIPVAELKAALAEFRQGGYRNEWTHQTKQLRPSGLVASLLASLDSERFKLRLKLEKKGAVVFDRDILETEPDEIIFAHRFKDVVLEGNTVVVRDKFGEPAFSVALDSLV